MNCVVLRQIIPFSFKNNKCEGYYTETNLCGSSDIRGETKKINIAVFPLVWLVPKWVGFWSSFPRSSSSARLEMVQHYLMSSSNNIQVCVCVRFQQSDWRGPAEQEQWSWLCLSLNSDIRIKWIGANGTLCSNESLTHCPVGKGNNHVAGEASSICPTVFSRALPGLEFQCKITHLSIYQKKERLSWSINSGVIWNAQTIGVQDMVWCLTKPIQSHREMMYYNLKSTPQRQPVRVSMESYETIRETYLYRKKYKSHQCICAQYLTLPVVYLIKATVWIQWRATELN